LAPAVPGKPDLTLGGRIVLAEIPPSVNALKGRPELIAAWQRGLRRVLGHYFDRGYIADDFIFGERAFYVLRRPPAGS